MSGKTARRKGHNFEREVAILFREFYPEAIRNLEYQEGEGVDIANTGEFSIQCKVGKSFRIEKALAEAVKENKKSVAITKKDRQKIVVSMYWDDFKEVLNIYLKGSNK